MKETLGESTPAYSTVTKWHAQFKWERSSCDDLYQRGRPATSVNEEIVEKDNKLVMNYGRLSVCFITESVGISTGRVHSILMENLLMKKVSARWVPQMLSDAHKANWVDASTSLLHLFNENSDNFISRLLTTDENWLQHFDPKSKMQSMAWKHVSFPPARKLRVVASAHEVMATVLGDAEGIVLIDYLQYGRTITGIYYADLIRKARAALKEKRWGSCVMGCCFTRTTHLLTHHLKHRLHPKCRIRTTPSPTIFARLGPKPILFVS